MIQGREMARRRWPLLIITLLLALSAIGCVEMSDSAQTLSPRPVGEIHGARTVGQTFVASHDGLSRIDVQLATYARRNTQPIIFHLRSDPSGATDIATITFEAEEVEDNVYRPFRFPPIPDSEGRSFYFFLESPTSRPGDAITIWHDPNDVYADGQMYTQGKPLGGDLAFKTYHTYGPGRILKDACFQIKRNIMPIFLMISLCLLPGYVLLQLIAPGLGTRFDLPEWLILALGLSLALIPLVLLLYTVLGLKLDKGQARGMLAGLGAIGLAHASCKIRQKGLPKVVSVDPAYPLLFFILLLSLLVRSLPVRDFLVPPGSDSYHHALITQLIIDKGQIPDSYEPYASIDSFTYHFGFHSLVAFFGWLSGIDVARSVLIMGQLLNGLIPLSVFFFAARVTKSKTSGLLSALITGLLSVFPAYYVNWGRFTQGAGLVLLPIVLALTIECLEREKKDARALIVTSVILSGLLLTHYRLLVFYLAFMAVYLVYLVIRSAFRRGRNAPESSCTPSTWESDGSDEHRQEAKRASEVLCRFLVIGVLSVVLVSPWIWRLFYSPTLGELTRTSARPASSFFSLARLGDACFFYSNYPLLVLCVLGTLRGLWRKERPTVLLLLWVGILLIFGNPYRLALPGAGFADFVTIVTSLFFPASIAIGCLGAGLLEAVAKNMPKARFLAALLIVTVALGSASRMFTIVNPESVYVQKADNTAMEWIRENTADEAKFLVASLVYDRAINLVIGLDGGYWIPLLTGRRTTVPPLTYLGERLAQKDYIATVVALSDAFHRPTSEEALCLFRENGVSYLYIGKRCAGIDVGNLVDDPHYRVVYDHEGVRIFELHYQGVMAGL